MNERTTKGGVFTFRHPSGTTCVILTDETKFDPGDLVSSAGADDALDFADACLAVGRHLAGDWGRASGALWARNERALLRGDLLVSTHRDRVPDEVPWQDEQGRLWDVLWMQKVCIGFLPKDRVHDAMLYTLYVLNDEAGPWEFTLKAVCGPGDDCEPVVTIMLPDED